MDELTTSARFEFGNLAAQLINRQGNPLVSVIVRTTFRPELADALESVKTQLYRPVEVVLVDAAGRGTLPALDLGDVPCVFVTRGRQLSRPEAANLGLETARGKLLCFLDEDDFFSRVHLLTLVAALLQNPTFKCAYSGVKTVGRRDGDIVFFRPFSRSRLLRSNFIPIHAAVFTRDIIDGSKFDERLLVYEDWDFFLQLAEKTDFLFVPRVTAFYRAIGTSSAGAAVTLLEKGPAWQLLEKKWLQRVSRGWDLQAGEEIERLEREIGRHRAELAACQRRLILVEGECVWLKGSRAWRVVAPFRSLWHRLHPRSRFVPPTFTESSEVSWEPSPSCPLISVVLPIFEVASKKDLLAEAINSVVNQDYPNVELVVVDDGSTDSSFDLACEICEKVPIPAVVTRKPNGGQSSARNWGAARAHGEWLAFLDQDDLYETWRFTAVADLLQSDAAFVYTDVTGIRSDGSILWPQMHSRYGLGGPHPITRWERAAVRDTFVVPGVMTIRRDLFSRLGGFDESLTGYEDDDLVVRILESDRAHYRATPTLRWRMHGASSSQTERMVISRLKYWTKLESKIAPTGNRKLIREIRRRFLRQFYLESLWSLADNSLAFLTSLNQLGQAKRRAGWPVALEMALRYGILFYLARRSKLIRKAIRTPRADWQL